MNQSKNINIILIAITCIFLGAIIGLITNMINGVISPLYFRNIMQWHDINNIWSAIIAQGLFEGLIYGCVFSVIFTLVVITTKPICSYSYAVKFLMGISITVLLFWLLGGVIAIILASLSPEFYQKAFIGVPEDHTPMLKYAWVGGSIWGGMFGGFFSAIVGSLIFKNKWQKQNA